MDIPNELRMNHAMLVVETIKSSFSGDDKIRKPAEQRILILQEIPGYLLLMIV